MSTMTMPGFTAESSVYRTSGYYQMTVGFAAHGNVVHPQIWCDYACMANCRFDCDYPYAPGSARCHYFCQRACCGL